jgi:predicted PurR-regulated permease PerM
MSTSPGNRHEELEKPLARPPRPGDADPDSGLSAPAAAAAAAVRLVNFPRIILFAAAVYLALSFFEAITKALLLFFSAFLLAIILNAPVRWLETRGVPRAISAAGVALIVLASAVTTAFVAGPLIANEAVQIAQQGPRRLERLRDRAQTLAQEYPALRGVLSRGDLRDTESMMRRVQTLLPRLGRYTLGVAGSLAAGFFVLVVALYTLGSPRPLVRGFLSAVPPGYRAEATHALTRIVGQLEYWALSTLVLMLVVGVVSGVAMWLIGVPNPLLFGIIAGLGEAIPTIGPILSALPPMLVVLGDNPTKALYVALLFLAVQQLENNLLVPLIMARNLKLHPVSILFWVLALGAFIGILGALLAVPIAIIAKVVFEEFYEKRRGPRQDALDEAADQILRAGARPGKVTAPRTPVDAASTRD